MRRSAATVCFGLVLAAVVGAQPSENFLLARGETGRLKIGMTQDEVIVLFGRERVRQVDLKLEGHPSPALEIRLDDPNAERPSLVAEPFPPAQNRIGRVRVYDPRFKTGYGLGVGSTLDQIRAHHAVRMAVGEGTVLAFVQELEMSFGFGRRLYPSVNLPASAKVESVLVVLPPRELLRQPPVQKR
jgi:hypothetical protein